MFSTVRTTNSLSLDDHFLKRAAATFFVVVEGDGMVEHGIFSQDTLIVDRSLTAHQKSIVVAITGGDLTLKAFTDVKDDDEVWGIVSGSIRDFA